MNFQVLAIVERTQIEIEKPHTIKKDSKERIHLKWHQMKTKKNSQGSWSAFGFKYVIGWPLMLDTKES